MISKILKIRFLQIKRSLHDLTIIHVVLLLLIFGISGLALISNLSKSKGNIRLFAVSIGIAVFYIHISRLDKKFIDILTKSTYKIFRTEYTLLVSPFLILLIFLKSFIVFAVLWIFILVLPFFKNNISFNKSTSIFSRWIPCAAFEWRAGLRKNGILILILYTLALSTSWIRIIPLIFLFFGLVIIAQFFQQCEPLNILFLTNNKSRTFLRMKIFHSISIYGIITLPVILLIMILDSELWFVPLIFFILACINLCNFILIKYTFYYPNYSIGGGSIITSLSLLGCIIPFFAPIPLFLLVWHYFKSKKKMSFYLND